MNINKKSISLMSFMFLFLLVPFAEGTSMTIYVSPQEGQQGNGTNLSPFASLLQVRDYIRSIKQTKGLPDGGIEVILKEGEYKLNDTLVFTKEDSGTPQAPIIYRGEENAYVSFNGGIRLEGFKKVENETGSERLHAEVKDKIYVIDLKKYGIKELPPLELAGFGSAKVRSKDRSYNNYNTCPCPELFFNKLPMTLSRFPNEGFLKVAAVHGEKVEPENPNAYLMKNVRLKLDGCNLAEWSKETNILLYGYWYYDWADSYETVISVDKEKGEVQLAGPGSAYGYREGARYYAINLLCELDQPGEWYIDREHLLLYFYPPTSLEGAIVELSLFDKPMVIFDKAEYISFERVHFRLGASNLVQIFDGEAIQILGCSFRESAGYGLTINMGKGHRVQSCDFHYLGKGGIYMNGGDRKTLTPSGFIVDNCYFSNLARIDHTYNPAVYMNGVGHKISHNLVHHIPSSAFRTDVNDSIIEFNEVFNVLLESDDQGGADMWGNPTYRGLVFRYNYWHHIGSWREGTEQPACGQAGIRLDDAISGVHIYGNIFYHSSAGNFGGAQIHGGKATLVENCIFANCRIGISCSPWTRERWLNFVKDALDNPAIDKELYLTRYPDLKNLLEDNNKNSAQKNIFWNCGQIVLRKPSNFIYENNLEIKEPQLFPKIEFGDFTTNSEFLKTQNFEFEPIPFEKIGLYIDQYRKELPLDVIQSGRRQN